MWNYPRRYAMPFYCILFLKLKVYITEDYKYFQKHLLSLYWNYIKKTLEKKYNHFEIIHILMALLNTTLIAHLNWFTHLKAYF